MTQCPNCGAGPRPDAIRCVKCGSTLRVAPVVAAPTPVAPPPLPLAAIYAERKSAGLAFLLSLLIPGLGQLYDGEPVKAVLFFVLSFGAWFACIGWIVHLVAAVEAMNTARSFNRRLTS